MMKFLVFIMLYWATTCILYAQDDFISLGIHPGAASQPTSTGKKIAELFPWKGKLYAGYGDYGDNTGPIDIYSFDPDLQEFTFVWEANTEAIYNYREYNERVFAPAIDRKSYSKPGDYTMRDTNGVWNDYNFSGSSSTHVYDVALVNDTILYMVGSQDERAAVWESKNNGVTWKTIHYDTAISGNPDDFARYYFAGSFRGKLYVQAKDYYGPLHPYSDVWDGSEWVRESSLFGTSTSAYGNRPDTFSDKMIYLSPQFGIPGSASPLRVFDGISAVILNNMWVIDFVVDSNYLYALVDSGYGVIHVQRTTDLINWEKLAKAPYGCNSLAIMNDKMYLGMNNSEIMESTMRISDLTTKIIDEESQNEIVLYPNPCSDDLNILFPNPSKAVGTILDYSGKILMSKKVDMQLYTINVSFLPAGLYFLKIENDQGTKMMMFCKR